MWKRTLVWILVATLGWTTTATAQQWSAEQQEVIETIRTCWDAWVEALDDETPDYFFETCNWDPNAHFWWTDRGAPQNMESISRNWDLTREIDDNWADMRPVTVTIFGDVAVAQLYGYWRAHTPQGIVTTEDKRTEVFQRRNGEWFFIGSQGSPAAPEDAEPYQ